MDTETTAIAEPAGRLEEEPAHEPRRPPPPDDEPMSGPQIADLLRRDADRLERAERELLAARFAHGRATDRSMFSTDAGHQAVSAEADTELRAAEAAVAASADSVWRTTAEGLRQLRQAASQPTLTAEETAIASNAARFVEEDCERLPWPALRDRVRAASLAGDRAGLWLYQRYLPDRLSRTTAPGDAGLRPADQAAQREVELLLRAARHELRDRRHDAPIASAEKALGRASALVGDAGKRARRAETEAQSWRFLPPNGIRVPD